MLKHLNDVGIYHGNCPDGFTSAWVLRQALGTDTVFFAATYGKPPPDVEVYRGRNVYIADFSYDRETMKQIAKQALSLTVFDHHKSAKDALEGLREELDGEGYNNARIVFDMGRSGARITWDEMFTGHPAPWLVLYVEDRDIWKWMLRDSKTINAYIGTVELTFENWDALARMDVQKEILERGRGADGYLQEYCRCVAAHAQPGVFEGYAVAVVNATYKGISDTLNYILDREPGIEVAIGWFVRGDGLYQYSLRSRDDGPLVNQLALKYGGGGHDHAAGFTADHLLAFDPFAYEE